MTRLWLNGVMIAVEVDSLHNPLRLLWRKQLHHVQHIHNRWRVDREWWRQRIWREYLLLDTKTGLLLVVFHDLLNDKWYLQRLYD
jgi:hypothetical protein